MGFARLELSRGNIERDGAGTETQRVEAGIRAVEGRLQRSSNHGDFRQSGDGVTVDTLHARLVRVDVQIRQHGIASEPVEVGALDGAGSPFVDTPVTAYTGIGVVAAVAELGPTRGSILVGLAIGQVEDLLGGSRHAGRGIRELSLVVIVDRHGLAEDRDCLGAGRPSEFRALKEAVVALNGGEIVTIGVTVPLGEHPLRVCSVDGSVGGGPESRLADVVVQCVEGLARVDAPREVPIHPIVDRRHPNARRQKIIPAAQQAQFFLQHIRNLAFEGEARGVDRRDVGALVHRDRRIGGVGKGFIAQYHVEVVQVARGEQQRIVSRGIVVPGIDADRAGAIEKGLVDLDQAEVVDVGERQGDVALPALARLREHAHVGVDRGAPVILDALIEWVDARQRTLHEPLYELGFGPAGPCSIGHDKSAARLGPVAHREVVIPQHEQRCAERIRRRSSDRNDVGQIPIRPHPWATLHENPIRLLGGMKPEIQGFQRVCGGRCIEEHFDLVGPGNEIARRQLKLQRQPSLLLLQERRRCRG